MCTPERSDYCWTLWVPWVVSLLRAPFYPVRLVEVEPRRRVLVLCIAGAPSAAEGTRAAARGGRNALPASPVSCGRL